MRIMNTLILIIVVAALCFSPAKSAKSYSGPPREMLYQIRGECSGRERLLIEKSLINGWNIFDNLSSHRMGKINFRQVGISSPAHVVIEMTAAHNNEQYDQHPAEWRYQTSRKIAIYWRYFQKYSSINQARVVAHELSHLYYGLDDQYNAYYNSGNIERPKCLMGNYFSQKTVGYCEICQPLVNAYFNRVSRRK